MPIIGAPLNSDESIMGLSWFAVLPIFNFPSCITNQAQPEPKRPIAALVNSSLNFSNELNAPLIASEIFPDGAPPPFGFMICQKKLWFQTPPLLFLAFAESLDALAKKSFSLSNGILSVVMASFTFFTY